MLMNQQNINIKGDLVQSLDTYKCEIDGIDSYEADPMVECSACLNIHKVTWACKRKVS